MANNHTSINFYYTMVADPTTIKNKSIPHVHRHMEATYVHAVPGYFLHKQEVLKVEICN